MLKRPLNPRFNEAVLTGRKTTTIRDKAWPVGVPIMLYNWSGAAYRSKQNNVAAITVALVQPIRITRNHDKSMSYQVAAGDGHTTAGGLWQSEGFDCQDDMDAWFRLLLDPGKSLHQYLMHFTLQ